MSKDPKSKTFGGGGSPGMTSTKSEGVGGVQPGVENQGGRCRPCKEREKKERKGHLRPPAKGPLSVAHDNSGAGPQTAQLEKKKKRGGRGLKKSRC